MSDNQSYGLSSAANVYPSPGSTVFPSAGLPPMQGQRRASMKRDRDHDDGMTEGEVAGLSPETVSPDAGDARKKQKRNKPTLSCRECVARKTKVRQ